MNVGAYCRLQVKRLFKLRAHSVSTLPILSQKKSSNAVVYTGLSSDKWPGDFLLRYVSVRRVFMRLWCAFVWTTTIL